jgi:hypothetical protein
MGLKSKINNGTLRSGMQLVILASWMQLCSLSLSVYLPCLGVYVLVRLKVVFQWVQSGTDQIMACVRKVWRKDRNETWMGEVQTVAVGLVRSTRYLC